MVNKKWSECRKFSTGTDVVLVVVGGDWGVLYHHSNWTVIRISPGPTFNLFVKHAGYFQISLNRFVFYAVCEILKLTTSNWWLIPFMMAIFDVCLCHFFDFDCVLILNHISFLLILAINIELFLILLIRPIIFCFVNNNSLKSLCTRMFQVRKGCHL